MASGNQPFYPAERFVGQPGGIASLGTDGKVPAEQLPDGSGGGGGGGVTPEQLAALTARLDANEYMGSYLTASATYSLNTDTAADPAAGEVATDTGALADATELKINQVDQNGKDQSGILTPTSATLMFVAFQDLDKTNWAQIEVPDASQITQTGDVFTMPVQVLGSAGTIPADIDIFVTFTWTTV